MDKIKIKDINFIQIMKIVRTLTKEDYAFINGRSFVISDLTSSILRLGIYVNNHLAGFCAVHLATDDTDNDGLAAEITIAIDPKYRGKGLSKYLLTEVKEKMKDNIYGITKLYYGVLKGNNISSLVAKRNKFTFLKQNDRGYVYYCEL